MKRLPLKTVPWSVLHEERTERQRAARKKHDELVKWLQPGRDSVADWDTDDSDAPEGTSA